MYNDFFSCLCRLRRVFRRVGRKRQHRSRKRNVQCQHLRCSCAVIAEIINDDCQFCLLHCHLRCRHKCRPAISLLSCLPENSTQTAIQSPNISSFSWHPLPFFTFILSPISCPYAFGAEKKAGIYEKESRYRPDIMPYCFSSRTGTLSK